LQEEAELIEGRLRSLDAAIERLKKGDEMKYNCVVKEIPERYVASVRQTIPRYDAEGMLWHILFSETAAQKMKTVASKEKCFSASVKYPVPKNIFLPKYREKGDEKYAFV
jgi:hypothetical protein